MTFKSVCCLFTIFFITTFMQHSLHASPIQDQGKTKEKSSMQTQIQAIMFDFGGVIAKTDNQQVAHFIMKALDLSEDQAWVAVKKLKEAMKDDEEDFDEEEFWISYAESEQISLPADWTEQLDLAKKEALHTIPGMLELVQDLKKQGFIVGLLSNVHKSKVQIRRDMGFYDFFDPLLLSCELGVKKPDPKIFEILLNTLQQLLPEEILLIDDKQANIEAAGAFGIDGIKFSGYKDLIEELLKRGIEQHELFLNSPSNTNPSRTL